MLIINNRNIPWPYRIDAVKKFIDPLLFLSFSTFLFARLWFSSLTCRRPVLAFLFTLISDNMAFEEDGIIYIKLDKRGELNLHDSEWDDGIGGHIKQILLWHDNYFISGIQTIYERRGAKLISKMHGGSKGNFKMINPKMPLTWVSGHYGSYCLDPEIFMDEEEDPWNYNKVITSLKFGNDEETFGPFGCETGTPFIYHATTEITGFHGFCTDAYSGEFGSISAIGLYIKTDATGVIGEPSISLTSQIGSLDLIEGENKQKFITKN